MNSAPSHQTIIRYLDTEFSKPIRDPLWGHIYVNTAMMELVYSAPLQQLNRIKQLGPTYLVYPGAAHTRLNHSLGVLHMARRMIRTLITFETAPKISLESVKAFLCAALLHDVGHFPYTHSLKELPLKEHETLTGEIIQRPPLSTLLSNTVGVDPHMTACIVDLGLPDEGNEEIRFFRRLLSSPLDPDKLDYLNRDAYFCGVPYGIQDSDFVLSQILPHPEYGIGLFENGISALENLLFSKYQMYRAVYWHRTVRIATGMIKKALFLGLQSGSLQPEQLYNLDDEGFFVLLQEQHSPEFKLVADVQNRRLFKPVCELPFSPQNSTHTALRELSVRINMETQIAAVLQRNTGGSVSPRQVLIDIPEDISFEVDIPVYTTDGWIPYSSARSVFTPQVVRDFTDTLRLIRVAVDPQLLPLPDSALHELTEILQHGMA